MAELPHQWIAYKICIQNHKIVDQIEKDYSTIVGLYEQLPNGEDYQEQDKLVIPLLTMGCEPWKTFCESVIS